MKKLILSFLITPPLHCFSTLQEMVEFAKTYDEVTEPDNHDYTSPDYFSAYALRRPSWVKSLKTLFIKDPAARDTLTSCKEILATIVKSREIRGFNHRHILKLNRTDSDTLIVWGDLQGAFHSCVRSLVELERQGIIDNNLVVKPDHYLIFNGNITGETDSGLELIECIASLMIKNPNNVICNAGPLEDRSVWTDHGLFKEISALAGTRGVKFGFSHKTTLVNNMLDLLTRFFNTLPIAIFIDYPKDDKHYAIRISGFGADAPELNTRNFDDFFNGSKNQYTDSDDFSIYRLANVIPSINPALVRVFISSIPGISRFEKTEGLLQIESIDGSIVWSIFSSPSTFQRKINKFYFDAFTKIHLHPNLDDVTIELIHRDARTIEPFHTEQTFLLASGVDITKNEANLTRNPVVVLGSSLDLSKGASNIGTSLRQGIIAALDDRQQDLKPGQPKIKIAFFDDKLSSYQSSANVEEIKKHYHLPIITFPITSDVLVTYLDQLRTGSLLALFPVAGSTPLHSADYSGVIFFRPSYNQEIKALIREELLKTPNGNVCFIYQDDDFGRNALSVARVEMAKNNRKWIEIAHLPNQTNFDQQIKAFKKHSFTAIFFISLSLATREFIQQLGTQELIRMDLYGVSMLSGKGFHHFMDELGLEITLSQVVPSPYQSQLEIVKNYRISMDKRNIPYSVFSLEGYICGALLVDAAAHIKGPINKETLTAYFTGLRNYNFEGLMISFNPEYRDLSQTVWLDQGNPVWKEYRGR